MQAHFAPARENVSARESPSRLSRSLSGVNRPRSSESWIEVSSQASSSQASSLHGDEQRRQDHTLPNDPLARRRRRLLRNAASSPVQAVQTIQARTNSTATSSQEEYEESDSASDRILTSSNENLSHPSEGSSPINLVSPSALPQYGQHREEEEEDDDDENATALGIGTHEPVFTPPANAFSHPPHPSTTTTTLRQRQTSSLETRTTTSYFPSPQSQRRPSFASNTTSRPSPRTSAPRSNGSSHTPYNMISPSHRADHDAALRASLSTLLSCARALPKRSSDDDTKPSTRSHPLSSHQNPQSNRITPSTLALIPPGSDPSIPNSSDAEKPSSRRQRQRSPTKPKRKSSPPKDRDRATTRTKPRQERSSDLADSTMQLIPPTLLTWVVSAGVVVLFSAIGFSAGYVIGREVGRVDVMDVAGAAGGGADKQIGVGRGLRKLGRAGGAVVRVA